MCSLDQGRIREDKIRFDPHPGLIPCTESRRGSFGKESLFKESRRGSATLIDTKPGSSKFITLCICICICICICFCICICICICICFCICLYSREKTNASLTPCGQSCQRGLWEFQFIKKSRFFGTFSSGVVLFECFKT